MGHRFDESPQYIFTFQFCKSVLISLASFTMLILYVDSIKNDFKILFQFFLSAALFTCLVRALRHIRGK